MVLREYGITPLVFDKDSYENSNECLYCLPEILYEIRDFAVIRGGDVQGYKKQVQNLLEELPAVVQRLFKSILISDRLVSGPFIEVPSNDWIKAYLSNLENESFWGVFYSGLENIHVPNELFVTPQLRSTKTWWENKPSSFKVKGKLKPILECLMPLLKYAKEVIIADPHMDFKDPQYETLFKLIEAWAKINPHCEVVLFKCLTNFKNNSLTESQLHKKFQPLSRISRKFKKRINVKVFRNAKALIPSSHDRYIFSKLVNLELSNGLTKYSGSIKVNYLDRDVATDTLNEFDGNVIGHQNVLIFRI